MLDWENPEQTGFYKVTNQGDLYQYGVIPVEIV